MSSITVGSLIEKARKEQKKITRKKLVRGLCSEQALFAIETSQSDADILMTDVLLQRLGKSPDKLEVILSLDTYQLVRRRDLIEAMIMKGKRFTAKSMLEKYPKKTRLDKMFYHRMIACLLYRIDKDFDGALRELDTAIQLTLPEFTYEKIDEYLISTMEMENLLAMERLLYEQDENKNKTTQMKHLEICMQYIDNHFKDEEEHAKICAKCSWLLARYYYDTGNMTKAMVICEKGIEGLRQNTMIYFMYPLLELMTNITESLGISKEKNKWLKYYEIMNFLWDEYAKKWYPKDLMFHNCYQKEYHLDYELIRSERIAKDIKQEELIEGIYQNPESLSRLENGKASPNKNTFSKLMKKLGLRRGRYNGFIVTDSFEIMELRRRVDKYVSKGEYEIANEILAQLMEEIDLDDINNLHYVQDMDTMIKDKLHIISFEDGIKRYECLLSDIYNFEKEFFFHVPTRNEIIMINHYINCLYRNNSEILANKMYKIAISKIATSKIDRRYRYHSVSLLMANYSRRVMKSKHCKDVIKYEIQCGKASVLPYSLDAIVHIYNECENKNVRIIEYAEKVYSISDLYYFSSIAYLYYDFLEKTIKQKIK